MVLLNSVCSLSIMMLLYLQIYARTEDVNVVLIDLWQPNAHNDVTC
jgi:hypothetical protein